MSNRRGMTPEIRAAIREAKRRERYRRAVMWPRFNQTPLARALYMQHSIAMKECFEAWLAEQPAEEGQPDERR